jgi:hypothetical protein
MLTKHKNAANRTFYYVFWVPLFSCRDFYLTFVIVQPSCTSRAPGSATQEHAHARNSNAAKGNAQGMEATSANPFRKECQGRKAKPSHPGPQVQSSRAIFTSQPQIQLTRWFAQWSRHETFTFYGEEAVTASVLSWSMSRRRVVK